MRTLASNKQERERIENYTRTYVNSYIYDDIYAQISEGSASGLFAHGHYDFDMERSLSILENMLPFDLQCFVYVSFGYRKK